MKSIIQIGRVARRVSETAQRRDLPAWRCPAPRQAA
jgi:hypothetical protein